MPFFYPLISGRSFKWHFLILIYFINLSYFLNLLPQTHHFLPTHFSSSLCITCPSSLWVVFSGFVKMTACLVPSQKVPFIVHLPVISFVLFSKHPTPGHDHFVGISSFSGRISYLQKFSRHMCSCEMNQLIKSLQHKHNDLNSDPQAQLKVRCGGRDL